MYFRFYLLDKMQTGGIYIWDACKDVQDLEDRFKCLKKEYEDEDIAQLVENFEQMREIHKEYVNVSYANETFYDLWVKYFDDKEIDLGRIARPGVYLWVLGFFLACDDAGLLEE